MAIAAYKLKQPAFDHPIGTIVYPATGYDYGLAADDTAMTGIPHRSMTLRQDGGIPSFTVAEPSLEPYALTAADMWTLAPSDAHVDETCRPGAGVHTCRYLVMGASGWDCAKLSDLAWTLDRRASEGTMTALGNNCDGYPRAPVTETQDAKVST